MNSTEGRLSTDNAKIQSITEAAAYRLASLSDSLCAKPAPDCWSAQQRFLMNYTAEQLIHQFPDCPRWASRLVDQLLIAKEEQGLD